MLVMGPLADNYGRRASILSGWFFITVFGLVSCLSPNIFFLVMTRMLVGIGIGASQSVAYDLFAESVPTEDRNKIGYVSFFNVFGALYVILTGYLTLSLYGWRWMAFACTLPIMLIAGVGYFYLSESPRWLASQGRYEEAELVLINAAILNDCHQGDIAILPIKSQDQKHYSDLLEGPLMTQTLTLWFQWIFASFSHFCVFLLFVSYFSTGNCSFQYGYLALGISLQIIGILSATMIMNYLGRVNTQMLCFICASLCMVLYGFIGQYGGSSAVAISMIFLALICTNSGGAVMWVHTVEMFPTEVNFISYLLFDFSISLFCFYVIFFVFYHFFSCRLIFNIPIFQFSDFQNLVIFTCKLLTVCNKLFSPILNFRRRVRKFSHYSLFSSCFFYSHLSFFYFSCPSIYSCEPQVTLLAAL
jgi:MFS transporter, putative metabolite:H+ symporter